MGLLKYVFGAAALSVSALAGSDVSWTATPFNPPAFPLAVRTPYLSAWLAQGSGTALNAAWPTFWTGSVGIAPHFCTVYS